MHTINIAKYIEDIKLQQGKLKQCYWRKDNLFPFNLYILWNYLYHIKYYYTQHQAFNTIITFTREPLWMYVCDLTLSIKITFLDKYN